MINQAKLISSLNTLFSKEMNNIKQTLIDNNFFQPCHQQANKISLKEMYKNSTKNHSGINKNKHAIS